MGILLRHPLLLSFGVLAALASIDAAIGVQITGAYGIAALVASMSASVRQTAMVAVASVLMSIVAGTWQGNFGSEEWATRAVMCAVLSAITVVAAATRVQREQRLSRLSVIAEVAQRAVLKSMPDKVGPVGLAARYVSASKDALVGGDLYEVAETPHGVRVIVGDVRGKGLDAVQLAASVLGGFRQAAFGAPCLSDVAAKLDGIVKSVGGDEEFVTAVLVEFREDGQLSIVNCGHHAPLLIEANGAIRTVKTGTATVPLGLGSEPEPATDAWYPASRMLLFTDGLVEARSSDGHFFSLDAMAYKLRNDSLDTALSTLIDSLLDHTGQRLDDDMALVLAEHRPSR